MPAPKGNQFWKLRSRHGRKKLFSTPKLLFQAASEYFQWCDNNPWIKKEQLKKPSTIINADGSTYLQTIADIPTARPYTLSGLCLYLDVNCQYFTDFKESLLPKDGEKQTKKQKDFSLVITRIEEIIKTQKFEGAAVGAFNANIIARDLGMVDKKEHDHKGIPSSTLKVEIVQPSEEDE